MEKINTVKGTKDLSGINLIMHNQVSEIFSKLCESKNFQEIRTPIIENSKVFKKTLGVASDIILKEMYNFIDQGGEEIVLRPEGTAAVARALITNSMQDNLNKKFYYFGPMFRREKPQTGRLRQFHQVGIEIFDDKNPYNDVESILIAENFLNLLGIRSKVKLEINSLGNLESRKSYLIELLKFLKKNSSKLSDESRKKLETNPLRILDSKNLDDREIIEKAARETGGIVTCEEHNIMAGFGSAVSEVVSESYPVPIRRIGAQDMFGESARDDEIPSLLEKHGITSVNIANMVKEIRSKN